VSYTSGFKVLETIRAPRKVESQWLEIVSPEIYHKFIISSSVKIRSWRTRVHEHRGVDSECTQRKYSSEDDLRRAFKTRFSVILLECHGSVCVDPPPPPGSIPNIPASFSSQGLVTTTTSSCRDQQSCCHQPRIDMACDFLYIKS
jgi:hypothetical protein